MKKKVEKNTWYPGIDLTADTIATATICCRIDICLPRIEFLGMNTCKVNMAQPIGLSHTLLPRPKKNNSRYNLFRLHTNEK